MRLITLLAGYAAGLAVAMKYRKDTGVSKVESDPKKSKVDNFIDEVVDIHKTAYDEVKGFVSTHFDDVNDFDSLKTKASSLIDTFTTEAEVLVASLKNKWATQGETVLTKVDALYQEKSEILDKAKEKGSTFADVAHDTLMSWIDEAKLKLTAAHTSIKSKLDTPVEASAPKKKAPAKKTPTA